jgi:hypothetical protein
MIARIARIQSTLFNFIITYSFVGIVLAASYFVRKSRDSSVGIALGYGLDDRGSRVRFPAGTGNFSFQHRVQNVCGAQCVPRVKRPEREADHSPPSSA